MCGNAYCCKPTGLQIYYNLKGTMLMPQEFSVSLDRIIRENELETIYCPKKPEEIKIYSNDVNRPGLQLGGFYEYFDNSRIQILGKSEYAFIEHRTEQERRESFETLFAQKPPAIVIARGLDPFPEFVPLGEKYEVSVLRSHDSTSAFMAKLIAFLNLNLAPRITRHGVLIEIYGEGVLILGDSGVGKSETAIELVKRGHRLVADDAVEIKKISDTALVGSSPEIIRHFVEVRGIGIIDIKEIFGVGSIKEEQQIDMVIHLEPWDKNKQYDRLGMVDEYTNIMGINIPSLTVPVKLGRNIAVIVEVAAMNNRQKKMGYNAAVELNNRLMHQMEEELNLQ